MDLTSLPPAVVTQIAGQVEDYILNNRKRYSAQSHPLSETQIRAMQPFFPSDLLGKVNLCVLQGQRILDPPFYSMLKIIGFRNLPEFSRMAAITFVDVIVAQQEVTDSLLFHELVHATQYHLLGAPKFAELYVNGFLSGGSYEEIPLEKHAYELEARFQQGPSGRFVVADEVGHWMRSAGS